MERKLKVMHTTLGELSDISKDKNTKVYVRKGSKLLRMVSIEYCKEDNELYLDIK